MAQDIEWFLGRDGQQYGPIKSEEIETLVRLGQLRDTDLLWHAGFADWLPAFDALGISDAIIPASEPLSSPDPGTPATSVQQPGPETLEAAPAPVVAGAEPAETVAPDIAVAASAAPEASAAPVIQAAPAPDPQPVVPRAAPAAAAAQVRAIVPTAAKPPPEPLPPVVSVAAPAPVPAAPSAAEGRPPAQWIVPARTYASAPPPAAPATVDQTPLVRQRAAPARDVRTEAAADIGPIPTLTDLLGRAPEPPSSSPSRPAAPVEAPYTWPTPPAPVPPYATGPAARAPDGVQRPRPVTVGGPKRRRRVAGALIVAVVALGAAGATYALWDEIVAATAAITRGAVAAAEPETLPAPAPRPAVRSPGRPAGTADLSPGNRPPFAAAPVWGYIAAEFPDWYAERVREATRLTEQGPDQAAVQKYLTDSLVSLRRNHASDALSASHRHIRAIAEAFVANLDVLKETSIEACYDFISHGEASDSVVSRLKEPVVARAIDVQLAAVFEAVREGRRQPLSHLPPRKSDYDTLADELVKLGWTDADLKTFSDPRRLSSAAPVVVCRLVRDWFRAHLAISDTNVQLRLIIESLKPVVAG